MKKELMKYWDQRGKDFGMEGEGYKAVCVYGMPDIFNMHLHRIQKRAMFRALKFSGSKLSYQTILDVGCGVGLWSYIFSQGCSNIIALDISKTMIKSAKKKENKYIKDPSFLVMSGDSLGFKDETFDMVFSITVLHHISDIKTLEYTIKEMIRVTKNKGKIIILEAMPNNRKMMFSESKHMIYLRPEEMCKLFEKFGGLLIFQEPVDPSPVVRWMYETMRVISNSSIIEKFLNGQKRNHRKISTGQIGQIQYSYSKMELLNRLNRLNVLSILMAPIIFFSEIINFILTSRFMKGFGNNLSVSRVLMFEKNLYNKTISLDIGCGNSKIGDIGIDIKKGNADIVADAQFLPFKNGSFKSISMMHVLEHLRDPIKSLKEVYRVLEPEGIAVIQVPNSIYDYLYFAIMKKGSKDHLFSFPPYQLINLAHEAGFRKVDLKRKNSHFLKNSGIAKKMLTLFIKDSNEIIIKR